MTFSVIDTGVGIRPEDHHKLFQAFSQVNVSIGPCDPGTGLGLHLSRKLADAAFQGRSPLKASLARVARFD